MTGSTEKTVGAGTGLHIHAWRWHHLAIERDLARLLAVLNDGTMRPREKLQRHRRASTVPLCSATTQSTTQRRRVALALDTISLRNWDIHDYVEREMLLPLIRTHAHLPKQVETMISTDRIRMHRQRNKIREQLREWANKAINDGTHQERCDSEAAKLTHSIEQLLKTAQGSFTAAENAIIPILSRDVAEEKQKRFNSTVVRKLDGGRARTSLVMFYDTLTDRGGFTRRRCAQAQHPGIDALGALGKLPVPNFFQASTRPMCLSRSTPDDYAAFRGATPAAVRSLVGLWRKRFLKDAFSVLNDV